MAGFEDREDAERFLADLRERFAEFGLELHLMTWLIEFGRLAAERRSVMGSGSLRPSIPGVHADSATNRCGGQLKRVTSKKKMQAKLKSVKTEMRKRRYHPIPEQGHWLAGVLQGHYNYYVVPRTA